MFSRFYNVLIHFKVVFYFTLAWLFLVFCIHCNGYC